MLNRLFKEQILGLTSLFIVIMLHAWFLFPFYFQHGHLPSGIENHPVRFGIHIYILVVGVIGMCGLLSAGRAIRRILQSDRRRAKKDGISLAMAVFSFLLLYYDPLALADWIID